MEQSGQVVVVYLDKKYLVIIYIILTLISVFIITFGKWALFKWKDRMDVNLERV